MSLDLYAKIEPLIGFYEQYDDLHYFYIDLLKKYNSTSVLDVGCGNGSMLQKLKDNNFSGFGIDLSLKMVEISKAKNLDCECKNINEIKDKFSAIVAIGDVLNYMQEDELKIFLENVYEILEDGGIFLADINTKYGFLNVADGIMVKDNENEFLSVEANFEKNILTSNFVYFYKDENSELFKKESFIINQYYYSTKDIIKFSTLKHLKTYNINMFSDEADKNILIFQKK